MSLQTTVDQIAASTGIDAATAERAVGIILSVIQQEADPRVALQVFAALPGAAELATANQVTVDKGGFLASIAGSVLGAKAGIAAAGLSQLQLTGLSLSQIEAAASKLLATVNASAGPGLASKLASALPGFGLRKT
jgi:hypothetical protein